MRSVTRARSRPADTEDAYALSCAISSVPKTGLNGPATTPSEPWPSVSGSGTATTKGCRRSKADVNRRYHHKHNQLRDDDGRRAAQRAAAEDADEQDRDENRETEAQKAHSCALHGGKVPARQPEPGDRLPGEGR